MYILRNGNNNQTTNELNIFCKFRNAFEKTNVALKATPDKSNKKKNSKSIQKHK